MGNFWLKLWLYIKVTVFSLIVIYVATFIYKNGHHDAELWVWPWKTVYSNVLLLAFGAYFAGVLSTLMIRTTIKTLRQFREASNRPTRAQPRGFDVTPTRITPNPHPEADDKSAKS